MPPRPTIAVPIFRNSGYAGNLSTPLEIVNAAPSPIFSMPLSAHRRRQLVVVAKISLAAAILAFLFWRLKDENAIQRLLEEPKQWSLLVVAQAAVLSAFAIICVRWCLLVRALNIDFPLSSAFRLGALGFLLSQVSLGSIGGDLFKAMCIARERPDQKTHAVASVVIDRVVGLYAMLLVASFGLVVAGGWQTENPVLRTLAGIVAGATVAGTVGLIVLLSSAASNPTGRQRAAELPIVGGTVVRLIEAADMYRNRRGSLYIAIGLGICTHGLLITGIWCISRAIPIDAPSLSQLVLVAPMSLFVGAIPATPGGLGTFEATMEFLYTLVGSQQGDGTLAALTYRAATYVVASVGAVYYISARAGVDLAIHDAEELAEHGTGEPTSSELL